jgi:hypothetical protein
LGDTHFRFRELFLNIESEIGSRSPSGQALKETNMKKLVLASLITLAGVSAMVAVSYADVSTQRRNSKYCRLSNSTDILCTGGKSSATNAQALVIARNKAENRSKYCRQDATEGDPLCAPKWKTGASAAYDETEYEDPVYE